LIKTGFHFFQALVYTALHFIQGLI